MPPFQAVVLDIDGTLTTRQSLAAASAALGLPPADLVTIIEELLDGRTAASAVREAVLRRWSASPRANRGYLRRLFGSHPLRPEAHRLVRRIKQLNLHACLITSSMNLFAQTIAARLAVEDWYANIRLDFDDAGRLRDLSFTREAASLKRHQLLDFCARKGVHPHDVAVIGDDDNDRDMFATTGNGIFVSHSHATRSISEARHAVGTLGEAIAVLDGMVAARIRQESPAAAGHHGAQPPG